MINLIQHRWVQQFDLNCRGILFGGRLLSFIDEDCTMICQLNSKKNAVYTTGGYERVGFIRSAYAGDRLKFVYEIINVGTTSVTVLVKVYRMVEDDEIIFSALATLVCIDSETKRPCKVEDYLNSDFNLKELRETKKWKDAEVIVAALKAHRKSYPCPN
jgi:acyl-CoA thioesterase YciA